MENLKIRRTTSADPDFVRLADQLSAMLAKLNGEADEFYTRFSQLDSIPYVAIAEIDGLAVGCGGIRKKDASRIEVKRMFTDPGFRGKGVAVAILAELESWARELGYSSTILETMGKLESANALYRKTGYEVIPNYPPYEDSAESVCFEKKL